jgi:SAM-dependent methyltransferase
MEFDRYASDYRAAVDTAAGVSVEGLAGEKARLILDVLARNLGDVRRLYVLDLGCGIGLIDGELQDAVGLLCGADVSLESLRHARGRAQATRFIHYDGSRLPFADASFDAVFASCVLHHVPPASRPGFLDEMLRPLKPGGIALIIEHNALNPMTRLIVSRCAFDADAVLLTCREAAGLLAGRGARVGGRRYVGFVPMRHTLIERAERAIGWLPAGAQYCVWGRKVAGATR